MNKKYINQISALLLGSAIATGTAGSMTSVVQAADYVRDGKAGEYRYQVFSANEVGDVVFDAESDVYSCSFSNYQEAIYMLTKSFNGHSIEDYGTITIQYDVELNASADSLNNVFYGINGWAEPGWSVAKLPVNDFYVVDGWADWRPPGSSNILDTVEIDGVLYDIYKTYRIISNTGIHATDTGVPTTFWSVRRENLSDGKLSGRVKSTITLSEHMKVWEKFGFDSSALVEAGFCTEGYRSVEFNVKVNSFNVTTDLDKEKPETKLPEEDAKEPEEKSDACALKGDCDNNGAVNTADYLIMKKYLLGLQDTNINIDSLDLDGDGKVNISDYILLRNILLDLT